MHLSTTDAHQQGQQMAKQQSVPDSPTAHEMSHHVRDYSRFTVMFKWGAIICALIGLAVLLIIS
ncbi:MAG: hypothetical protein ABIO68_01640 [Sphingomicrobium sp.]